MSGVRGYGMPPYSHISYRECPICGKPIKNFEMHTRNRNDHQKFRKLQDTIFRQLIKEFSKLHPNFQIDGRMCTALNQTAWSKAIEILRGSTYEKR